MTLYKTFIRSCSNWKLFAKARKMTQSTGLSYEEARQYCDNYNGNRTSKQIQRESKMELTAQ